MTGLPGHLAAFALVYAFALFGWRLGRTILTAPMHFLAAGYGFQAAGLAGGGEEHALSLVVLRPLAIWLSLRGTGLGVRERLFLGWFGPRGLATALFAPIVLEEFDLLDEHDALLSVAALAVTVRAVLHGVAASPSARLFAPARPVTMP